MVKGLANQPRLHPWRAETRHVLETAVGIVVGLRRCSIDAAYQELTSTGERYHISTATIASALVNLASGNADPATADSAAALAAQREWGGHLPTATDGKNPHPLHHEFHRWL